jgi:hypothetical protein
MFGAVSNCKTSMPISMTIRGVVTELLQECRRPLVWRRRVANQEDKCNNGNRGKSGIQDHCGGRDQRSLWQQSENVTVRAWNAMANGVPPHDFE